jgi:undecaprenyl pyrophosphate phosphatase UppP
MSFIEKQNEKEQRFLETIKAKLQKLNPKQRRLTSFSLRVVIYMLLSIYFSGLIHSLYDVIYVSIGLVIFGLLLFFLPWNKVVNFFLEKF